MLFYIVSLITHTMDVLIVGGTKDTMKYWNYTSHLNNYYVKYNSSNCDPDESYGRNRFGNFCHLGNRLKNKYDVVLFEYCPFMCIFEEIGGVENLVEKIKFLTKEYHTVIIPIHSRDMQLEYIFYSNNSYTRNKEMDLYDGFYDNIDTYDDYMLKICSNMKQQNYNIYYSPDWNSLDINLFTNMDTSYNRFIMNDYDVQYIVITNYELNMMKFEDSQFVIKNT